MESSCAWQLNLHWVPKVSSPGNLGGLLKCFSEGDVTKAAKLGPSRLNGGKHLGDVNRLSQSDTLI